MIDFSYVKGLNINNITNLISFCNHFQIFFQIFFTVIYILFNISYILQLYSTSIGIIAYSLTWKSY